MTRKIHQSPIPTHPSVSSVINSHRISPAFLGHTCPQDVQNSINFHRDTLSEEVCQFLSSRVHNLPFLCEFWSRPQYAPLTSGRAADTICGASWMLALNYLFLGQLHMAGAFTLNGAFIQQTSYRPIAEVVTLSERGSQKTTPLQELPYYVLGRRSTKSPEDMQSYLLSVLPMDFMRRMAFASHAKHTGSGSSTWVRDYVSCIGNDWDVSKPNSSIVKSHAVGAGDVDTCVEITLINDDSGEKVQISIANSQPTKELFTKYSEEQDTPLRLLRFSFKGKVLFLSSASKKTPTQLGMNNGDVIHVSSATTNAVDTRNNESKCESKKKNKKAKKILTSSGKRTEHKAAYIKRKDPKEQHSQVLSKLFDEAGPTFRAIRQRLNRLSLERTLPKRKVSEQQPFIATKQIPVNNPNTEGLAGKAGKTSYVIHVGEVNNLYKSSKKSRAQVLQPQMIDLHGYTQHEALQKLDESLPIWEKYAMEGSYPFVAPVVIICGGGNQILSETVSYWIKENNVSNAPGKTKNAYASAA
ncbi:hypothetical protein ACHAXN_004145 [Cyclotella atomus]